ncbi:23S rRNA (adenine(2030)-N(6))-methyltransferase RlmJ [Alginatibacterium sediminis]|uniref:Ribosomal RNA large subunit methyltransferase J n=1 Tax=Alginatibacterium sediminis TaxID=2164068 RepID=A0A420ECV9_9ALTE|nr:23S rRNA (adenine(2030)-N(6))-methyltransferase RlmJ [Alginatibacterium sediminis]RKF18508.1 23S rRNA (adenine(2030)-N(6))-methyltransferase RlmJ [Alginatibacterium sediminis]
MLSYRHSFHAGNYADVLKHVTQLSILDYMCQKDAPIRYVDTHSGAGGYSLEEKQAQTTLEYKDGIQKLLQATNLNPLLQRYASLVQSFNDNQGLSHYPGSPWFAQHILRPQDRLFLHEIHPSDFPLLAKTFSRDKRVSCRDKDGFEGLVSLMPPREKRAMVLIDPPYEIKSDYKLVVETIIRSHKRFKQACIALWYPVVKRERIQELENQLVSSGIRNIQLFELGLSADSSGRGMTSSGMIVVNPPWTLMAQMNETLPLLSRILAPTDGQFRAIELVGE